MKKTIHNLLLLTTLFALLGLTSCADDKDDPKEPAGTDPVSTDSQSDSATDTATVDTATADTATTPDTATSTDTAATEDTATSVDTNVAADQTIGSACTCTGSTCESFGVPLPAAGAGIAGCDDVPSDHAGERVCLRTYGGTNANPTYFANGYCALQAIANCEGAQVVCNNAVFGDYAAMTSCPAGSVLVEMKVEASVLGGAATASMDSRVCTKSCSVDSDCRSTETDAVLGEATQYACLDSLGTKFCYDPRNLPATYTATAF